MNFLSKTDDSDDRPQVFKPGHIAPTKSFVEFKNNEIEQSIPARFEKIVAKYPDRLAVKMRERSLTYDELNRVANRIARAILDKRGQGSEPIVLFFEHGIDAIAAMFGTLKAGKFYVVLDPSSPAHRNTFILDDSQASLIVTNNRNLDLARKLTTNSRAFLNIDELNSFLSSDNLRLFVAPEDRLSIVYTSGSTGKPKGIIKAHRNSARNAEDMHIRPEDRLSLLHSLSYGSAIISLFSSLLNGASLFPFDLKSEGVHRLTNWLTEEQITVCHLAPAAFRELADSLTSPEKLLRLRLISLSGAPITQRDFDLYQEKFCSRTLLNILMGSTETGRSFSAIVDHSFNFPKEGTPLGYPVGGQRVFLLDDDRHEVGPNQVGEIAIKSRNINPGYWRRPELTSAKFLPDASGGDERVYLTGDLGRMLPDGFLIHMGRKDLMVKVRGYRVELTAIESALSAHPQVREAGVVAWDREPGEKYLVAYVVPCSDPLPTINELYSFLKQTLPDYMIPSAFVFLESLPRTNGKLERSALPLPDNIRPNLGPPYVRPRNAVEEKLVQIWERVLDIRPIGVHDDFFAVGGHSLQAARLFIQVEKTFGKNLSPATLFEASTIERLAETLRQKKSTAPWSLLVPIQPAGSKPPFFWACGYSSDIFLPRYLGADQPLYGLLNQCHNGKRPAHTWLGDIAARHLKEIRRVQPEGPYFLGGFCFGGMVAFEIAQQLRNLGHEVALLVLLDLATIKNCKILVEKSPIYRESFRDKASRHLSQLSTIGPHEKLTYVFVRATDRLNGMIGIIKNLAKTVAYNICLFIGQPVPLSLRLHYIAAVDRYVLRDYDAQVYPGRIVHIKAEVSAYDPHLVEKLTSGDVEIYEVACSHSDLIKESHIGLWADTLKRCLSTAQANSLSRGDHCPVTPARDFKAKSKQF